VASAPPAGDCIPDDDPFCAVDEFAGCIPSSGVTMGWLLRLVTGGPTGGRGPSTVLEFLVINFSVCLVLLSNCYIIIYCTVWFQVQPLMVVFQ